MYAILEQFNPKQNHTYLEKYVLLMTAVCSTTILTNESMHLFQSCVDSMHLKQGQTCCGDGLGSE